MKPLYLEIHDGLIDDIRVTMEDIKLYEQWIKESYVGGALYEEYKQCLKICESRLKQQRREYKEKYGHLPHPNQLK